MNDSYMQGEPDSFRGLAVNQEGTQIFISDGTEIKVSKVKDNFSLRFLRAETVKYLVYLLPRVADPVLFRPDSDPATQNFKTRILDPTGTSRINSNV